MTTDSEGMTGDSTTWSLEFLCNGLALPMEMAVGFVCQVLNLLVLRTRKMHQLAMAGYMRALAVTYLLSIVFMIPAVVWKNGMAERRSLMIIFYHAHLEQYLANVFLFTGSLIIVVMAAEPLLAMTSPLKTLTRSPGRSKRIVALLYFFVGAVLAPTILTREVTMEPGPGNLSSDLNLSSALEGLPVYTRTPTSLRWVTAARLLAVSVFEIGLIFLVTGLNWVLLLRFRQILRRHRAEVRRLLRTSSRDLRVGTERVRAMSLATVTAFVLCNLASALKELLSLFFLLFPDAPAALEWSQRKETAKHVANVLLLFNFTLIFLLQCAFCRQYRAELRGLLARPCRLGRREKDREIDCDRRFANMSSSCRQVESHQGTGSEVPPAPSAGAGEGATPASFRGPSSSPFPTLDSHQAG